MSSLVEALAGLFDDSGLDDALRLDRYVFSVEVDESCWSCCWQIKDSRRSTDFPFGEAVWDC